MKSNKEERYFRRITFNGTTKKVVNLGAINVAR